MSSFILIPGAGGEAWYWHRVVPELERRGHDAVAVHLPAEDDGAGLDEYAQVVLDSIGDRPEPVLVAQSMGGFTAPLVCARIPVRLLVLLNAMTPRPGEPFNDWWANTGFEEAQREQAEAGGWRLEDDPTMFETFFHDVPPEVRREAIERGDPDQSGTPCGEPWPLDAWPDVPTRFLQARDDRFFPLAFQRKVVTERLGIEVDEMPGGHLVALSRPVEVAQRLVEYDERLG